MDAATRAAAQSAIHEAFISGYRWVMWASAALCVLGAAVAAVLMRKVAR
ncbi:MAG: hypothetical protein JF607_22405 [Burkholderiales bacterium]|nr:hypothetical protein [Burkholderiales bacterium]